MYNHNLIEKKWQKHWEKRGTYKFRNDNKKPKFYVLDMFPYPSGSGLHVGHPKGYTATDAIARFKILNGFNVLHPIGWDAFGLPAEQYALQTGNHPKGFTEKNIQTFRKQLKSLGFNYDYKKEVNTTDPKYYQWTQWIFTKLFEKGLAELQDVEVNWCQELGTVLANEEVLEEKGKKVSERGGFPVVKKPMRQWVLKITKYADKLLSGLDVIDWPNSLKSAQRNWIGRSEGALILFKVNDKISLEVFTTKPETIFGVTFIALSPENRMLNDIVNPKYAEKVEDFISKNNTDKYKTENDLKQGIFIGSYAIHPITKEEIPIYVANYVLQQYGTGIIMGVPAVSERDQMFAKKYKIPSKEIYIQKEKNIIAEEEINTVLYNSDFLNDLTVEKAKLVMIDYLEAKNIGSAKVNYKLRDWLFSRQRYWGEPFPILFDLNGKPSIVNKLPVILPETNKITPTGDGRSPLANINDWMTVKIGDNYFNRDTNTMPQWAGSCWYYLGYLLKKTNGKFIPLDSKKAKVLFDRWLPVDVYIGGQEHAVLHLLYARFWHRFLYDIGVVSTPEPFQRIINQGMILGPNGEKMSKSKGNVINPDEIVKTHGADALRLYETFMGPLTASLPWTEDGLDGVRRWLDRVYRLVTTAKFVSKDDQLESTLITAYHKFVRDVTFEISHEGFNVAVSHMMVFINECYKAQRQSKEFLSNFAIVLSCFAPHLAEEIWWFLKNKGSVSCQTWPKHDESKLISETFILPVQVNGKLKHTITIAFDLPNEQVEKLVLAEEKITSIIGTSTPKKIIIVKNKIVNIII